MKRLQEAVSNWQQEAFGNKQSEYGLVEHLKHEVEELDGALSMGSDSLEEIENELADIIILTIGIASLYNIELENAVADKLAINREREWNDPDEFGVINHKE